MIFIFGDLTPRRRLQNIDETWCDEYSNARFACLPKKRRVPGHFSVCERWQVSGIQIMAKTINIKFILLFYQFLIFFIRYIQTILKLSIYILVTEIIQKCKWVLFIEFLSCLFFTYYNILLHITKSLFEIYCEKISSYKKFFLFHETFYELSYSGSWKISKTSSILI